MTTQASGTASLPRSASEPVEDRPGAPLLDRVERAAECVCASHRVLAAAVAALAATVVLLQWQSGINASYVWITAAIGAVALLVAYAEETPARLISINLFVWAMFVRLAALAVCHWLALADGEVRLGPDSATYLLRSTALAASGFQTEAPPPVYYGTYNVAHYYLFAGGIRFFGADLFGLQVMNAGLVALTAPLAFGFSKASLPSAAPAIGLAVALNPNLIVLSSIDLLKDPSILCAVALLIWAVIKGARDFRLAGIGCYAAVALIAALYVRTARFYALGYLEGALIGSAIVLLIARRPVVRRPAAIVLLALAFVIAEALPTYASWPPSPALIVQHVQHASPSMTHYSPGLVDKVVPQQGMRDVQSVEPVGAGAAVSAANLFRRLFGPFVWILPPEWSFRVLRGGDYLLYPGMLFWYALLPFVAAGIWTTGIRMAGRRETRFGLLVLWFFTVVYFAQYFTINLSYRQRDVMLPLLLVFACVGGSVTAHSRTWRWFYGFYWLALIMIACAHLVARSLLRA